jgi:NADH-quinone oxidoreductase subunit H
MSIGKSLLPFLVLPGLVYALPMAWLMLWIERKMRARMQGRSGPGFYQPFFDFIKLMAKRPIPRSPLDTLLMIGLPASAIGALLASLALLPVFSTSSGFIGDLVLLIGLIEVPSLCAVLAGFASRSIFGEVGATREALLSITHNLPFLTAIVALAASAKSIRLTDIVLGPSGAVRTLVVLTLLLCLPVKLRINPFSLSNAEQEIYAGPTTEFDGSRLALWELAHGLEWVVLTGIIASIALPFRIGSWIGDIVLFTLLSLMLVILLTIIAAGTARLKISQATKFYLRWSMGMAILALIMAVLGSVA